MLPKNHAFKFNLMRVFVILFFKKENEELDEDLAFELMMFFLQIRLGSPERRGGVWS